jgi:c-di-GMP-binding flagellar brake protein YcgR
VVNVPQEPEQQITVEWGMPLQLRFEGLSDSYKSTLVGMERAQYLICSVPRIPGIWVKLHRKDRTIVRYVHKGVVYGFKSTLLGIVDEPFRLLLLSYPQDIETVRLRQYDRLPCLIPATAKLRDAQFGGAILDISLGGCCFAFSPSSEDEVSQVQPGDEIALSAQMPGVPRDLTIRMTVGSIRRQNSRISIGGSFKDLENDALTAVENYVGTMAKLLELNEF